MLKSKVAVVSLKRHLGVTVQLILFTIAGGDLHYHLTQHGVFSEDEVLTLRMMHCLCNFFLHLFIITVNFDDPIV